MINLDRRGFADFVEDYLNVVSSEAAVVLYPFSYPKDYRSRINDKRYETYDSGYLESTSSSYLDSVDSEELGYPEPDIYESPENCPNIFKNVDMDAVIDNCFKEALNGIKAEKRDVYNAYIDAVLVVPQSALNRIHSYEALMLHYFKIMSPKAKVRISLVARKPFCLYSALDVEIYYIRNRYHQLWPRDENDVIPDMATINTKTLREVRDNVYVTTEYTEGVWNPKYSTLPQQFNKNFWGSESFDDVSEFDSEVLLDFDNKKLYTIGGLDSMDVLSKLEQSNLEWETYYADSDSYNAEDSLTRALEILQEDSPECFQKSPDKFVIIEIGDSRSDEDKKHLFATVESILADYFKDYIDEDNELMFAIAENPELLENDLSVRVYSATQKEIK